MVFALQFGLGAVNPLIELLVRDLLALERLEAWSWISTLVPDVSVGDRASVETLATSLLFGGMAVTNLIALPLWGRYGDRVGHARAMMLCAAICVFALGVQALAGFYALLLVGRLLMGAAIAGAGPLAFGLAAAEVPSERRGGAFGVVFSARTLATAVGGVSGGLLSVWIGVRGLMAVSALLLLAVMLVFRRAPDQASTAP